MRVVPSGSIEPVMSGMRPDISFFAVAEVRRYVVRRLDTVRVAWRLKLPAQAGR
jgi:hypothetical protein